VEDHDRGRSRPEYEEALLDDLERLGLASDEPSFGDFRAGSTPYRQSDAGAAYEAALDLLRGDGLVYACDCARSTFAAWAAERGGPWRGIGCPGGCRERSLPEDEGTGLRVAVGAGRERWVDLLAGPLADEPAATGDLLARDRDGNWTYAFCVVVDDARHGVDLVIRGRDLLDVTPAQIRLARLLGRETPPRFLHHPLIRRVSGQKLSKAEGDTAVRALLDAGRTPAELFGLAARLAGLQADVAPIDVADLAAPFRAA
jgi:glutamyl-tRNA synthetase/glutamyl-Q tRNA(Asp) synthetase